MATDWATGKAMARGWVMEMARATERVTEMATA
jgi:hypothetical protein